MTLEREEYRELLKPLGTDGIWIQLNQAIAKRFLGIFIMGISIMEISMMGISIMGISIMGTSIVGISIMMGISIMGMSNNMSGYLREYPLVMTTIATKNHL